MEVGEPLRVARQWALIGTLACIVLVFVEFNSSGPNPLNLIQPGTTGPSIEVIERDFPGVEVPDGTGLDGQQFYAMARDPLHPSEHADQLDRPRYRWQRPLLAWAGWALHPTGGGEGLIWALVIVNVAGVALGSVAMGRLGMRLGGAPWLAGVFGVLPGAYYSIRVTVADALGLALTLAALALALDGRRRPAIAVAVAAVLAKEILLLVFAGWWLAKRDKERFFLAAVPAIVAIGWFVLLRTVILPAPEVGIGEFVFPFEGWRSALVDRWFAGKELWGAVSSVGAVAAAGLALARRGWRHPLAPIVVIHLVVTVVYNGDVIGQDFGGTRTMMPLLCFALLCLATPGTISPAGPGTPAAAPDPPSPTTRPA